MALDACAESFRGVREVLWPVPFPPPNEPACGFYGTRDQCRANDTSLEFSVTVGCSVLGSLLAAVFLMRIVQWKLKKRAAELHVWDLFQIGSKFLYSEVSKAKWASGRVQ
ncbi:hypothetical protein RvY_16478-2 [Ramazzottius varieornatus]|uniref:Uncharacterized protein n=1 Tax=Ramazzottius varieornatus TaxID=947166 RepID=A0A1D1W1E1_RAMVA|nr:hypothetical protein RvY_16478-2 [Ramazzottius varieornatus]